MFKKEGTSILNEKSFKFALRIVKMVKEIGKVRSLQTLYDQIIKSASSIHANIRESEFAQSPADFASKLSISLKEANETLGWLELLYGAECLSQKGFESLASDCKELIALLVASVKTIKRNNNL